MGVVEWSLDVLADIRHVPLPPEGFGEPSIETMGCASKWMGAEASVVLGPGRLPP